jgi:hypothetical protein
MVLDGQEFGRLREAKGRATLVRSNRRLAGRLPAVIGSFWVGLLILAMAGCAPGGAPALTSQPLEAPSGLAIAVGTDGFVAGENRVPFVAFDGGKPAAGYESAVVDVYPIGSGQSQSVWHGEATSYPDYDIPYWVIYPEFPKAGFWAVVVHLVASDGSVSDGQFAVQVASSINSPQIGDTPPASHNRTLDTEPDIGLLTSDLDPDPDLYRMTVAQALDSGRPTVVSFATPAYCTSRMCAPVLNSVKAVAADHKDQVSFIHIEVYKQFQPLVYADEMETWGLTSEPWTFVIDSRGKVAARLGGPLSPGELEQVLSELDGS